MIEAGEEKAGFYRTGVESDDKYLAYTKLNDWRFKTPPGFCHEQPIYTTSEVCPAASGHGTLLASLRRFELQTHAYPDD